MAKATTLFRYADFAVVQKGDRFSLIHDPTKLQFGRSSEDVQVARERGRFYTRTKKGLDLAVRYFDAKLGNVTVSSVVDDVDNDESFMLWAWGKRLGYWKNPAGEKRNPTEHVPEDKLREYLQSFDGGLISLRSIKPLFDQAKEKLAYLRMLQGDELQQALREDKTRSWDLSWDINRTIIARPRLFPNAWDMFMGILRHYDLKPADRRAVEAAIRFWSRRRVQTPKFDARDQFGKAQAWLDLYLKEYSAIEEQAKLARRIIDAGGWAGAGEEGKIKAGPFLLVNRGGFNDKVMAVVVASVTEAAKLMEAKGLGMACYGDAYVVGRVSGSNVAAQYSPSTDTFFVRASNRKDFEYTRNVIHELGHRLIAKFMSDDGKKEARRIYSRASFERPDVELPAVGETIVEKGAEYVVTKVLYNSIVLHRQGGDATKQFRMTPEAYSRYKRRQRGEVPDRGFVTKYASTDPEENFCELVSYYCQDKLPTEQTLRIETVLDTIQGRPMSAPFRAGDFEVRKQDTGGYGVWHVVMNRWIVGMMPKQKAEDVAYYLSHGEGEETFLMSLGGDEAAKSRIGAINLGRVEIPTRPRSNPTGDDDDDEPSPAWANKILNDHAEAISSFAKKHKLPDVVARSEESTSRGRKWKAFGCGSYGCVYATTSPDVVLKITSDQSEVQVAHKLMQMGDKAPEGIVRYLSALNTGHTREGSDVWVLWRETAYNVGEYEGEMLGYLELLEELATVAKAVHDQAREDQLQKLGDAVTKAGKELRHAGVSLAPQDGERGHLVVGGKRIDVREIRGREKGLAADARLLALAWMGALMVAEHLAAHGDLRQVGKAVLKLANEGILLADVRADNLGRVKRGFWAIVDPGFSLSSGRESRGWPYRRNPTTQVLIFASTAATLLRTFMTSQTKVVHVHPNPSFTRSIGTPTFAWRQYVSRTTGEIDPISEFVRDLKVGRVDDDMVEQVAQGLAEEVAKHREFKGAQAVVAMPRRAPGLPNDLEPLGRALAKRLNVPFVADWLVRTKEPTGGKMVVRRMRFPSKKHERTLAVPHPGPFRKVIVLDNVLSTGATLRGAFAAIERDTKAHPVGLSVLWSPDFWHVGEAHPKESKQIEALSHPGHPGVS